MSCHYFIPFHSFRNKVLFFFWYLYLMFHIPYFHFTVNQNHITTRSLRSVVNNMTMHSSLVILKQLNKIHDIITHFSKEILVSSRPKTGLLNEVFHSFSVNVAYQLKKGDKIFLPHIIQFTVTLPFHTPYS